MQHEAPLLGLEVAVGRIRVQLAEFLPAPGPLGPGRKCMRGVILRVHRDDQLDRIAGRGLTVTVQP